MPETKNLNFGQAIEALKEGMHVQRAKWRGYGKDMWLGLKVPYKDTDMTAPYIYLYTSDKKLVPWLASQTDMLADDWSIIK